MTWWQWVLIIGGGWAVAAFLLGLLLGAFILAGRRGGRRPAGSRPAAGRPGHTAGRRDHHDTGAAA